MNQVRRKDGRICRVIPINTAWDSVEDLFPNGRYSSTYSGDCGANNMQYYSSGGVVATYCGQLGLYDLLETGSPTCIACLARSGLRPGAY